MCTNCHYIYNRYIHKRILVPCGKCPSCLQAKANARANKIRSSLGPNDIGLFITLTYDNDHVPCINLSDLKERTSIPVYRGDSYNAPKIGDIYCSDFPKGFDISKLPSNVRNSYRSNEILGVTYYKDIQNFFKRLRINLYRQNEIFNIKYFACTEYGETYYRPHSHIFLAIPKEKMEVVRTCILKSWTMCHRDRLCRGIEIARDVAKYVASYVNCASDLPKILQINFCQKHANSKGFGVANDLFTLPNIVRCLDKNDLSFTYSDPSRPSSSFTVLFPKYAINRYFPLFKGFSRIPVSEVSNVLQRPEKLGEYFPIDFRSRLIEHPDGKKVVDNPIHRIKVQQANAIKKYINVFKQYGITKTSEDYYIDFVRAWNTYENTKLKLWYRVMSKGEFFENYDNVVDLCCGLVRSDLSNLCSLDVIPKSANSIDYSHLIRSNVSKLSKFINPNGLPSRVSSTNKLAEQFHCTVKRKKVTNHIMNTLYNDL